MTDTTADDPIADHVDIPLSEHSRVLLAMHTAMRVDAQRLLRASSTLPDNDRDRAEALGKSWAVIVGLVHDHHWTEDDVMYPFLLEHVSGMDREAEALENDHVELDAAMARVSARFRLLAHVTSGNLWQSFRQHLVDDARAFDGLLVDHLDREEAIVVPAVEAMTPDDQHDLHQAESKLATYRHMRTAIPWVLGNLPPEEERQLRALAPRLLATLSDHAWNRRFQRVMEPLYRDG